MKNFFLILISGFLLFSPKNELKAQTILHQTQLPQNIKESSGLETGPDDTIWTFNDSGGEPELYQVDTSGQLLRTVRITNAWNRDWEDITRDEQGNLYIGNIGNNSNKNTDLCIFKIPDPDMVEADEIEAEIIRFHYEDQHHFPPELNARYFDAEALMWFDNHLYISTKNRTEPFDGLTKLYRLPDQSGEYTAKKFGQYNTGGTEVFSYWITAGDISDDGTRLVLLSSDKIWLFENFDGADFYSVTPRVYTLPHHTQKEGIAFIDNNTVVITDEQWKRGIGRNIYVFNID